MARSRSASLQRHDEGRKRRRHSPSASPPRKSRRHSRSPVPRRDRDAGGNGYRGRRDGRDSKEEPSRSNREVRDAGPQTNREARMAAAGGSDRGRGGAAKANGRSDAPEAPPAAAPPAAPKGDGKTGGVYIPPFKLAQMLREQEMLNKGGAAYQRLTWDALRKSINGLVNKVNAENIRLLLPEIFAENLERGRGLLCRTLMKSQLASTEFSATFAALVAIINTKLPEVGELLLKRVVWQFRRAFQRNDKPIVMGCLKFIAHLINQQVAHEVLGLQILMMLLDPPTDDGVEAVLQFLADVGATLQEFSSAALRGVIDQIRRIMQEGQGITPRTATVLETWFASYTKAGGFKDDPIPKDLDLVESGDQITHQLELDEEIDREIRRDVFKEDPEYDEHEKQWQAIKREILGEDSEDEEGPEGSGGEEEEDDEDLEETERQQEAQQAIQDQTQTNLVNLRRTIYLTIMSSMDFEESGHKLMKINIGEEHKIEIVVMLIECCSQEKTYIKYYGLLSERFCKLRREYQELFEDSFRKQYSLIHRLETNKLRNVAKLFAHLLYSDGISWGVLSNIRLTEDDTTSSSRIFIKILFQALSEDMGLIELNARLQEPSLQPFFGGIFPKDTAKNMRFSINFFTSIGLGGLTDAMRDYLQNEMPRIAAERQAQAVAAAAAEASSSESDSGSDDDSSSSGSDSSDDSSSSGGSSSTAAQVTSTAACSSSSDDSSSSGSSDSDSDSDDSSSGGSSSDSSSSGSDAQPASPPRKAATTRERGRGSTGAQRGLDRLKLEPEEHRRGPRSPADVPSLRKAQPNDRWRPEERDGNRYQPRESHGERSDARRSSRDDYGDRYDNRRSSRHAEDDRRGGYQRSKPADSEYRRSSRREGDEDYRRGGSEDRHVENGRVRENGRDPHERSRRERQ